MTCWLLRAEQLRWFAAVIERAEELRHQFKIAVGDLDAVMKLLDSPEFSTGNLC